MVYRPHVSRFTFYVLRPPRKANQIGEREVLPGAAWVKVLRPGVLVAGIVIPAEVPVSPGQVETVPRLAGRAPDRSDARLHPHGAGARRLAARGLGPQAAHDQGGRRVTPEPPYGPADASVAPPQA